MMRVEPRESPCEQMTRPRVSAAERRPAHNQKGVAAAGGMRERERNKKISPAAYKKKKCQSWTMLPSHTRQTERAVTKRRVILLSIFINFENSFYIEKEKLLLRILFIN